MPNYVGKTLAIRGIDQFLGTARSLDGRDLASTLAIAHDHRLELIADGQGDVMQPWGIAENNPELSVPIGNIVRVLQQQGDLQSLSQASGWILWSHTIRATAWPEVRDRAVLLWQEFSRAFPYMDAEVAKSFPQGLDPGQPVYATKAEKLKEREDAAGGGAKGAWIAGGMLCGLIALAGIVS
jgi:hypothetical protein